MISCPCALVISTPVSVVSAIATAARRGVLIKGGVHLERIGAVRCVAFDKTGTLTKGAPHVVEVIPLNDTAIDEILEIAAGLEARSEHPVGRAILARAVESGIALPAVGRSSSRYPGAARRPSWRAACAHRQPPTDRGARTLQRRDSFAARCARGIGPHGGARGAPEGRPSASSRSPIARANRRATPSTCCGARACERVVMLTGDNHASAEALARELGIDETHAELLPHDKVTVVQALRSRSTARSRWWATASTTRPALAAADVGIAMGAAGTDAALETADIALMADELLKIPFAIRLGRATLRNIQMNVTLSLGLKAVFLALAVIGSATLWMAVVADMGASLLVIANGMRLLRAD